MRAMFRTVLLASFLMPVLAAAQGETNLPGDGDTPAVVRQLHLTDVEIVAKKRERYGRLVRATLPDGTRVRIDLDRRDDVEEVEARGKRGFPAKSVEALIPAAVRGNGAYPADASFRKLEFDGDRRIEIEGDQADGRAFKAAFTVDGRLLGMKTRK